MFLRALAANQLQENEEGLATLALAAMNIFQLQGPLHCRINPTKDAGVHWWHILIAPFYQLIRQRKQKCPETLHLREITALLEILHAGYLQIRELVLECLKPIAGRFDASALLWFFEDTLPLISLSYDGIFKAGMYEQYLFALSSLEMQAICQQRRNYKFSLLLKAAQMLWLQDTEHPLSVFRMPPLQFSLSPPPPLPPSPTLSLPPRSLSLSVCVCVSMCACCTSLSLSLSLSVCVCVSVVRFAKKMSTLKHSRMHNACTPQLVAKNSTSSTKTS